MALQKLQLAAAITASQSGSGFPVAVTSTAAFPPVGTPFVNQTVLFDSEFATCIGVPATNVIILGRRGIEGTAAGAHDTLTNVYTTSNNADWGPVPVGISVTIDPTDDLVVSIGQDGAIPIPTSNSVVNINKATALAGTLAAPLLVDNGLALIITSQTAAAHVVTATGLLRDGVTATGNTITFTAVAGATVTLIAEDGFWNVSAKQNVTVA